MLELINTHICSIFALWIIKNGQELVEIWPKTFLYATWIYVPSVFAISQPNLKEIAWNFNQSTENKIYIYVYNTREVILVLFGTINFTTKDWSQLVWTGFFCVVDPLGLVFKGPVAVPKYLNWFRLVAVASCLVLEKKKLDLTGLENTKADSESGISDFHSESARMVGIYHFCGFWWILSGIPFQQVLSAIPADSQGHFTRFHVPIFTDSEWNSIPSAFQLIPSASLTESKCHSDKFKAPFQWILSEISQYFLLL